MKRHTALFVLVSLLVSGASLFAQQRSGNPTLEDLKQAQALVLRAQRIDGPELVNTLRELERMLVKIQQDSQPQDAAGRIAAPGTVAPVTPNVLDLLNLVGAFNVNRVVTYSYTINNGAWWTNTALVSRLGLTDDQKSRIERAFENNRQNLTASKVQLEKEEAQLSKLLGSEPLDRTVIVAQISRVVQARGEMERINSMMTLEMREVLTPAQWTELQPGTAPAGQPGARGGGGRGPAPR